MDKQFNFKGLLLLMALALMAQFTSGCDGSGGGSDSTPSSKPNQQQDEVTAELELERLTLTPFPVKTKGTSELTLIMGHKQSFLAVAEYSNGQSQVLTKELTIDDWQSSDTEVGEFIQSGVLQSKDAGVVTVSFTKGNLTSNSVEVAVADAAITDIVITPSVMKVAKGHVQQVTATAIYSNGLSMNVSDSVTWTSDDTSIATITSLNDYSLVKGDGIGSTALTAFKDGVTSNTVDVEVTNAVITAINVTPSLVNIAKGQNKTLTATAIYSDNTSSNISDSVTWAPVDSSIANVTASGLLSGVKAGMTNLTAKKDGITSNEVGAVISDAVITSISVTPPTITLAKGQTQTLTATAIYSDNTSANISDSVTWKPNDTNTALVSSNGVLSGSNVGTTTLVAVKDSVTSNTIDIDVTDAVITEISVMPSVVNIAKGQRQTLRAIATYSDSTSSDISDSVTWVPVDAKTATVNASGVLSGSTPGTTTLTVFKDGVTSNTVDVEVTNAVITAINVTPSLVNIAKGQNKTLTATAIYSDNTSSNISDSVTWAPVDSSIANVTASGLLSGVKAGMTNLTAKKDGITSNEVGAVISDAVITSISVTPPTITLAKGQTQTLTATAIYSDNTSANISDSVTWKPNDTNTALVSSNGVLSGSNVGTTTLIAVKDSVTSNTIDIDVTDAVITEISVMPSVVNIAKGQRQTLRAIATYSDSTSSDISDSVTWVPVDAKTATVNASGVLSGSTPGTTTLTVFKDGVTSNTVDVEVTEAVITAINVTPSLVNIAKGQNKTLTATAIYSDTTSSNISDSVTWAPVDSNIANVTASGLLSGVKAGMTNLTAKKDGITSNEVGAVVSDAVITSISVTPPTITLAKGQTQTLTATAIYSDNTSANISDSVTWKPNDTNTALVSSNGVLSGSNVGTTTLIAVKDSVTSNTIDIDVTDAVITEISVMPSVVNIAKGQRQTLRAIATYSDSTSSDISDSVTWVPVDAKTATVNASGVLSGSTPGTTTLTVFKDGVTSNTVDVEVTNAVITAINVTPSLVNIAKGQNKTLTATAIYSDTTSSNISDSVTWAPVDSSIANVTASGVLSGAKVGMTTLTAIKDGVTSNEVGAVISDAVITSISVTPPIITLAKGRTQTLTATAIYSDNTSANISDSVTWKPIDTNTALVTSNGVLSGSNVGTTTLIAVKDSVTSNTIDIDVTDAVITEISVMPSVVNIAKGQRQTLRAIATYSDSTSSDISDSVTWVPVDAKTATVNASGVLSGSTPGTTTLTVFKDGVTSNTVDVEVTNAVITAINVTPSLVNIAKGQNKTLTATAIYSDATLSDVSDSVTWAPVDSNIANVTASGVLSGAKVGMTTLTAIKDGVTSLTVDVKVSDAVLTSISVTPTKISLAKGQNRALTATATYSDNTTSNISRSVNWVPVNTRVVNVDSSGKATGVGIGTTTVTAVKDGFASNVASVKVTNAVMTKLTVNPPAVGLMPNGTQQMRATATYSDGTLIDVTNSVSWSASQGNTISLTAGGFVTGLNSGTSSITARYKTFGQITKVNVCTSTSNRSPDGKCIYTLNVGNNNLFTNSPSVAYLDSLGIGGSGYTSGVHRFIRMGDYYKFNHTKAVALCNKYSEFNLAGRTNWRLPTVSEIKDIYKKNNHVKGWNNTLYYWTSSKQGPSSYYAYKYIPARPGHSWVARNPSDMLFAACLSNP